jgi:hypothetical protein
MFRIRARARAMFRSSAKVMFWVRIMVRLGLVHLWLGKGYGYCIAYNTCIISNDNKVGIHTFKIYGSLTGVKQITIVTVIFHRIGPC